MDISEIKIYKKCVLEFIKYATSLFTCSIYKERERGRDYYVSGTGFTGFTGIPSFNTHNCPLSWVLLLFHFTDEGAGTYKMTS